MTDYDKIEFITKSITDLLAAGGFSIRVSYEDSLLKGLVFNISSPDSNLLIGHQGTNLYALETIVHAIVAKHFSGDENPTRFSIDINEYKRKREWSLKQLVKDAVDRIKRTGQPLTLNPMPKAERKFIHTYTQEQFPHITTESIGNEPNRKIKMTM